MGKTNLIKNQTTKKILVQEVIGTDKQELINSEITKKRNWKRIFSHFSWLTKR